MLRADYTDREKSKLEERDTHRARGERFTVRVVYCEGSRQENRRGGPHAGGTTMSVVTCERTDAAIVVSLGC